MINQTTNSDDGGRPHLPRGRAGRKNKLGRFTPSRAAHLQLREDDVAILRLLDQHRLVSSRQLLLTVARDRNERAFLKRLRDLFDAEYAARPPKQFRPGQPARHMVYSLGIEGHRTLYPESWNGHAKPPKDWRQKDRRIGTYAIDHEVALTEVVLAFRLASEARNWSFRWSAGDAFRQETGFSRHVEIRRDYGDSLRLPLNPDAFVTAETGDHRYHWFLEIDMSTEPHERRDLKRSSIRQKMLAYWQLNTTTLRSYDRRRDSFRVLFVTTTEQRLHNMRIAAQEVDPKKQGSRFFLFSTHNRCTLDNPAAIFADHVWWSAKLGHDNPRLFLLNTCPKCHQLIDPANEPHEIVNSTDPHIVLASASSPIPDFLPGDVAVYAHSNCPGLPATQPPASLLFLKGQGASSP